VKLGHPVIANGDLLHSCVEVHKPIELSVGMVSGVGLGIDIQDGVHRPRASRGRGCF